MTQNFTATIWICPWQTYITQYWTNLLIFDTSFKIKIQFLKADILIVKQFKWQVIFVLPIPQTLVLLMFSLQ